MQIIRLPDTADLSTCLAIRRVVFIEGQNVPEQEEVDGKDPDCLQYLLHMDGKPVATARVLPLDGAAKIQRVAVLKEARSAGTGSKLMRYILDDLKADGRFETAILGSQTHAIGFYEKLGFEVVGPEYDDAGIPHRDMSLTL
ncbi:GNAT family N-acetyltransferase [uncultured Litoreibacter sp.]|uniref:GNAT family N-acetyltransferase n=1 Tax=uncultured Litoreibacter sp. TaxID=1392394 RepID=UPI00261C9797|nr:GNAT family N-acetyltransferase [uncultured Litoreibacter sp.]